MELKTSLSHRLLALCGSTFILFEIAFVAMLLSDFWFPLELNYLGIPAIILLFPVAHFSMLILESNTITRLCWPILRGRPLLVYLRWLRVDDTGITYGERHLAYNAIDSAELSFFGNLIFYSRSLCLDKSRQADPVLKLPFAAADSKTQGQLLDALREKNPRISFNKRLEKCRTSVVLKGSAAMQMLSGAIMFLALFDLGFSSFYYLEMLKSYFVAHEEALKGKTKSAQLSLAKAESMRLHPLSFSWVSSRLFANSQAASHLLKEKSEIEWILNEKAAAIADGAKAIEASPKDFRLYLRQARLLNDNGNYEESKKLIEEAIEHHKDYLLPRLYMLCLLKEHKDHSLESAKNTHWQHLNEEVFGKEPSWPPGGHRFLAETLYSEDLRFILERTINSDSSSNTKGELGSK